MCKMFKLHNKNIVPYQYVWSTDFISMVIMNYFVKWWIVQYLITRQVGGVKKNSKLIVVLENMNSYWKLTFGKDKLKKHDFIDSK